jgi:signal transduction histidine kinase
MEEFEFLVKSGIKMSGLMKKLLIICFTILLAQNLVLANDKVKNIVIFFGLNTSLPSYQNILEGFQNTLSSNYKDPFNLSVEYLDISRTTDSFYAKGIVDLYNKKFEKNGIDLLIVVGPGTLPLLKKYNLKALIGTPIISVENGGVNSSANPYSNEINRLDITLRYKIDSSLKSTFKLFPKRKTMYVIGGNSKLDLYYLALTKNAISKFDSSYHFIFISGISFDSTLKMVDAIPKNSLVVVPIYYSDKNKAPYSTPEAQAIIANRCKVPVIPLFDSYIRKRGPLGGYIFSFTGLGKAMALASIEVFNGVNISDIKIDEMLFYENVYDWNQLKKWDLQYSKDLPKNSIFLDRGPDFFDQYKWPIIIFLFLLFSQSFLIAYLIKLNRRQREFVKQKAETELMYREIIREDRLSRMSELTASISHELNQPLTAILYSAQAGMRFIQSGKLNEDQAKEIFENIIEDAKRAGSLISSVKSLMKLENREWENVHMKQLIDETIDIFHAEAVQKRIQFNFQYLKADTMVYGDRIQLQQVILNLISNAAYTIENCNADNRTIELVQESNSDTITISVRDHGSGIDPLVFPKLFQPFVSFRKDGFGIGLVLSKSIIENHSGKIWAENAADGGAIFYFRLKIKNK